VKTYGEIRFHAPDEVVFERGVWQVFATPDVLMRLKRLFPRAQKNRSGWISFEHTLEIARDGLQHVCNVGVFGELDWSPGIHDQCEGRYHRDGQTEPSVSYFLVSDVGSDPVVADVLNLKEQVSRPIIDPDRPLFEAVDISDRMRKLAKSVLNKRRTVAA
jgi:hypothetical protein